MKTPWRTIAGDDDVSPGSEWFQVFLLHPRWFITVLVLFFIFLAWTQRIVLDDAFISFRYASNLVQGHGLLWNPGDPPVEGYTNFLWVLITAIGIAIGLDPVVYSTALGLISLALVLVVQAVTVTRLRGRVWDGFIAVLLLGGLYSFRAFSTTGLETMLQALLVLLPVLVVFGIRGSASLSTGQYFLVSLLAAAAVLTRMDSAVLLVPPMAWMGMRAVRTGTITSRFFALAGLAGPLVLTVVIWTAWRLSYYGYPLPNTYYAKVSGSMITFSGFAYLHYFLSSYLLYPLAIMVLVTLAFKRRNVPSVVWCMVSSCLLWVSYLLHTGGDFMEYRFMVPLIPFFVIVFIWVMNALNTSFWVRGALVLLVLFGSLHHQTVHRSSSGNPLVETTRHMHKRLTDDGDAWISIGKSLRQLFNDERHEPVTIAVSAAGAIPYYSGLRTIDMLGLSDPWIARNGLFNAGNYPGHRRITTIDYLRDRGVHLLLGHPTVYDVDDESLRYLRNTLEFSVFWEKANLGQLSSPVRIVEIPVLPTKKIAAVYLSPHQLIDDLIARGILKERVIDVAILGEEWKSQS